MKIRLQENTIRFRLRQPEVSNFQATGKITETIAFGTGTAGELHFSLVVSDGAQLSVKFEENTVTVGVPGQLAEKWALTDMVGFDGKIDTGKGKMLGVLVEKDFVCLDRPEEENAGAYPNPNTAC